jgi:predicted nicotinamide N-methyase
MVKTPDFIRANTRLLYPPLVPEIRLHLADESVPIWLKTEEQLGRVNIPPPFWAFAWAGGQALARYVLDNAHMFTGRSVLDLGTGSGLVAIAAKLAGAKEVLAADIDETALEATMLNARENSVVIATTSQDLLGESVGSFDIVLVGDLFYERQLAERVMAYLATAKVNGAIVLIGDPQRNYFPADCLKLKAEYQVPVTRELEDALVKRSAVWEL